MQKEINKTEKILRTGGIILYPTDTVWGIGCDATNEESVNRIYKIKKRVASKKFIVLVSDEEQLKKHVINIAPAAWDLIKNSNKPLTIIYEKVTGIASNILVNGSAAIRITKDEFCKKLIKKFGKPIVSTSANISSSKTPSIFNEINAKITEQVDYVVNLRQKENKTIPPSTIIKIAQNGEIIIIRK